MHSLAAGAVRRFLLGAAVACSGVLCGAAVPAGAYPLRGHVVLNVLLCMPNDQLGAPPAVDAIRNELLATGTGGLGDYFKAASNGLIDFSGSTVNGWYVLPHPAGYYSESNRGAIPRDCLAAAQQQKYQPPPASAATIVLTTPYLSSDGNFGTAVIASCSNNRACHLDDWAHEIGHALGWRHPYSTDVHANFGGPPGDYDDEFNVMSSMADDYSTAMSGPYGLAPPLPDAYQMDQLGWLPQSRVKTFGADGSHDENVTLVALGHPEIPGIMLLRIPVSSDPFSYYTVEMVAKDGWNAGIDHARILIKNVQPIVVHPPNPARAYYTFLYRDPDPSGHGRGAPWSHLSRNGNGVTMNISLVSMTAHHAVIHVTAYAPNAASNVFGPNACAAPFVWRSADDNDYVCTSPAVRDLIAEENRTPEAHRSGSGCQAPFVFRNAFPGDGICVSQAEAQQALADNAAANGRLAEPHRAGALGPQ